MEAKTFSRNSLVYRFLAWPTGNLWFSRPYDICQLRRDVIMKILLLLLIVSSTFGYSYSVTSYLMYEFGGGVMTEIVKVGGVFVYITLLFTALAAIFCGLDKAQKYFQHRKWERDGQPPKPNGPIKEMYLSWKDKLCYRIDFQ